MSEPAQQTPFDPQLPAVLPLSARELIRQLYD